MTDILCVSCRRKVTNVTGTTEFICPSCGNAKIVRCMNCRQLGARYKCSHCSFEGPN